MSAYKKAAVKVKNMNNDSLAAVWDSIRKGGLGNAEEINHIRVDDWIEIVYVEMSNRKFV